ncbi:ABC transporter permease [Methylobacterium brachythecii]|uniref:Ribose transport system permease protein n=1 Tax=Methylobacterium brachythecii TaxID=1176177 RepID=A0A7W6F7S6_9HYPH|nr:ABC transporter permease [Methylobacterium brachythecii]MBB3903695.1 ribose transport system permease protein [Methylobacterium brachythecii]GLS44266.1 sugar transporter permease [Methylobacterium brachythecii]
MLELAARSRNIFKPGQGKTPALLVLMLVALFSVTQSNFLSTGNISNVAIQSSYLIIFALAQTYVMIVRGFDLSIGSTVSLISVASSMAMSHALGLGFSPAMAISSGVITGIAIGLVVGLINGVFVAVFRLNPFIVTLATMNICLGLASSISNGFQIFNLPDGLNATFYQGSILGIPVPVVAAFVLVGLIHVVLTQMKIGRSSYILGANPQAAFVAGIPVTSYLLLAYALCSALAACGAILLTARTGSGEPNLGGNLMLESIAAAVVGGASLRGGSGSAFTPVFGAVFITILSNGMNLSRIDGYIQQMILGAIIICTAFGEYKGRGS